MMKNIFISTIALGIMIISSCKKDPLQTTPVASLTLINTIAGGKAIKVGSRAISIANNSSSQLALNAGEDDLYIWPVGDSANPYYSFSKFFAEDHGIYSLFLGGTPTSVDGVMIKEENIPYHTDSTCGIRFINLSPNSPPLKISLNGSPSVDVVNDLAYKQYTEFKIYPALSSNVSYSFQIKNSLNGNVLLNNYSFNLSARFTNATVVIRGLVGGGAPFGATRVLHER